jgi:hypothetical protein
VFFAGLWQCEKQIMKVVVLTICGCLFLSVLLCVIVLVVLFQVWIHRVSSVSSQTPCSVAVKLQLPFLRIFVCVRDKGRDPEVVVLECSLLTRLCFYSILDVVSLAELRCFKVKGWMMEPLLALVWLSFVCCYICCKGVASKIYILFGYKGWLLCIMGKTLLYWLCCIDSAFLVPLS